MTDLIAVLGDVHLEPQLESTLFAALDETLRAIESRDPSRIVVLGDVIQETSPETDRRLLRKFTDRLDQTGIPFRCVPGNHDLAGVSPAVYRDIVGHELWSVGEHDTFVYLDSTAPHLDGGRGEVSEDQFAALRNALPRLPGTVVFVHHPVEGQDLAGNYWHESSPADAYCVNMDTVTEVLHSGDVAAVVSGHLHWWAWSRSNGLVHVTVDAFNKERHPRGQTGNYALLETGDSISGTKVAGDGTTEELGEGRDRTAD